MIYYMCFISSTLSLTNIESEPGMGFEEMEAKFVRILKWIILGVSRQNKQQRDDPSDW